MNFIDQADKGNTKAGSYVLTILAVFVAFILGQSVMVTLGQNIPGVSIFEMEKTTDLNTLLTLLMIPFIFVFLTILLCVRYIHQRPILSVFTARDQFDWKRFFTSFLIWGVMLTILHIINYLIGADYQWHFDSGTFFPLLMISLFLLPIQTTAEDLLFRGYLLQGFKKIVPWSFMSILITGSMFGMMHAGNPEVELLGNALLIYYIFSGIFLGMLTHLDNGMELGMGYHVMNNIFGALIITNDWQAFQTNALLIDHSPPAFGWDSILILAIVQPLLLFLYSRIYKWGSWKEKLLN